LVLPRVTAILRDAALVDGEWFQAWMLDRGSAVHLACRYLDEGDLDWESLDPLVVRRVRQYQQFLEAVRPEILAIEEEVENVALQYAGRLDRRVRINSAEGIYDIKGIFQHPSHALQLSGYAGCFDRPMRRWNLYLDDEKYRLVEHKDRRDWEVFKAAVTLAAWKRESRD
jgi:hypothetical protein